MWGKGEKMTKNRNRAAMASVIIITVTKLTVNTEWADTITGKVVAVADSDTLTVISGQG